MQMFEPTRSQTGGEKKETEGDADTTHTQTSHHQHQHHLHGARAGVAHGGFVMQEIPTLPCACLTCYTRYMWWYLVT